MEELRHYKLTQLYKLKSKIEFRKVMKTREVFCQMKEELLDKLGRVEKLLVTIDSKMYNDRKNLVTLLKYVGGGIEGRERNIKEQLKEIAMAEMDKG